jgi:uncharacterized protein (TIGR04255 family)
MSKPSTARVIFDRIPIMASLSSRCAYFTITIVIVYNKRRGKRFLNELNCTTHHAPNRIISSHRKNSDYWLTCRSPVKECVTAPGVPPETSRLSAPHRTGVGGIDRGERNVSLRPTEERHDACASAAVKPTSRQFQTHVRLDMDKEPVASVDSSILGYLFKSTDGFHAIQCRFNGFSFSRLVKYEGWDRMLPQARHHWAGYREQCHPLEITRLAVRTINVIETDVSIDRCFIAPPVMPPGIPAPVSKWFRRLEVSYAPNPVEPSGAQAIITEEIRPGARPGTSRITFDIDVFKPADLDLTEETWSDDRLWTLFDGIRKIKNDIFFATFTEEVLATVSMTALALASTFEPAMPGVALLSPAVHAGFGDIFQAEEDIRAHRERSVALRWRKASPQPWHHGRNSIVGGLACHGAETDRARRDHGGPLQNCRHAVRCDLAQRARQKIAGIGGSSGVDMEERIARLATEEVRSLEKRLSRDLQRRSARRGSPVDRVEARPLLLSQNDRRLAAAHRRRFDQHRLVRPAFAAEEEIRAKRRIVEQFRGRDALRHNMKPRPTRRAERRHGARMSPAAANRIVRFRLMMIQAHERQLQPGRAQRSRGGIIEAVARREENGRETGARRRGHKSRQVGTPKRFPAGEGDARRAGVGADPDDLLQRLCRWFLDAGRNVRTTNAGVRAPISDGQMNGQRHPRSGMESPESRKISAIPGAPDGWRIGMQNDSDIGERRADKTQAAPQRRQHRRRQTPALRIEDRPRRRQETQESDRHRLRPKRVHAAALRTAAA